MSTPPSSAAASPTDPNYAFVNVVTDGNWPDSMGKAPKTRKRITKTQLAMLEELFRQCSHPSREERQTLAAKTGMYVLIASCTPCTRLNLTNLAGN